MINCIIVDDEEHAVETLAGYVRQISELNLLGGYANAADVLNELDNGLAPDLVFLDIDMPRLSGFELARLLPERTPIIYVTGHAGQALEAFDTNVFDFLLKPVSFAKFLKSVQKVKPLIRSGQIPKSDDYFFINPGVKGKMIKLRCDEVIYIQGLKNYVIIYMVGGKFITYLTMKETEEALPKQDFFRIHKSYIINLGRVQSIEGNTVVISERLNLPLGGVYKEMLMNFILSKSLISKR